MNLNCGFTVKIYPGKTSENQIRGRNSCIEDSEIND